MGAANKLLIPGPDGRPMLRHSLDHLLAALPSVVVVLGHEAEAVRAALGAAPVIVTEAPDAGAGLSASLRAGLAALPPGTEAALVALGDMPCIAPGTIRALLAAHRPGGVTAPAFAGRIGHPILWDRRYFPAMARLTGDRGARSLLPAPPDLHRVDVPDAGILIDFDTPDSLKSWRRSMPG